MTTTKTDTDMHDIRRQAEIRDIRRQGIKDRYSEWMNSLQTRFLDGADLQTNAGREELKDRIFTMLRQAEGMELCALGSPMGPSSTQPDSTDYGMSSSGWGTTSHAPSSDITTDWTPPPPAPAAASNFDFPKPDIYVVPALRSRPPAYAGSLNTQNAGWGGQQSNPSTTADGWGATPCPAPDVATHRPAPVDPVVLLVSKSTQPNPKQSKAVTPEAASTFCQTMASNDKAQHSTQRETSYAATCEDERDHLARFPELCDSHPNNPHRADEDERTKEEVAIAHKATEPQNLPRLTCRNCRQEGHTVIACPHTHPSLSVTGCRTCGDKSHSSADCPSKKTSDFHSVGDRCKCGKEGYHTRDCPAYTSVLLGIGCFECGEKGHISRDCTQGLYMNPCCMECGGSDHSTGDCPDRLSGCFICGDEDHTFYDCPIKPLSCSACGQPEHISSDCSEFEVQEDGWGGVPALCSGCGEEGRHCHCLTSYCYICGGNGHPARECPEPPCYECGKKGHPVYNCPKRIASGSGRFGAEGWGQGDGTRNGPSVLDGWGDGDDGGTVRGSDAGAWNGCSGPFAASNAGQAGATSSESVVAKSATLAQLSYNALDTGLAPATKLLESEDSDGLPNQHRDPPTQSEGAGHNDFAALRTDVEIISHYIAVVDKVCRGFKRIGEKVPEGLREEMEELELTALDSLYMAEQRELAINRSGLDPSPCKTQPQSSQAYAESDSVLKFDRAALESANVLRQANKSSTVPAVTHDHTVKTELDEKAKIRAELFHTVLGVARGLVTKSKMHELLDDWVARFNAANE